MIVVGGVCGGVAVDAEPAPVLESESDKDLPLEFWSGIMRGVLSCGRQLTIFGGCCWCPRFLWRVSLLPPRLFRMSGLGLLWFSECEAVVMIVVGGVCGGVAVDAEPAPVAEPSWICQLGVYPICGLAVQVTILGG